MQRGDPFTGGHRPGAPAVTEPWAPGSTTQVGPGGIGPVIEKVTTGSNRGDLAQWIGAGTQAIGEAYAGAQDRAGREQRHEAERDIAEERRRIAQEQQADREEQERRWREQQRTQLIMQTMMSMQPPGF
jgi:hypothetical protein